MTHIIKSVPQAQFAYLTQEGPRTTLLNYVLADGDGEVVRIQISFNQLCLMASEAVRMALRGIE